MTLRQFAAMAVVVGVGTLGVFAQSSRAGVVHQYTFNQGNANDSVGTANGTVNSSHTTLTVTGSGATAQGKVTTDGTPASTAGAAVGVTLPSTLSNGITGDFTIEQFLTVAAQSATGVAFSIAKDTTHFLLLNPSRNGGPVTAVFDDGGSAVSLAPATGTIPTTPGTSGTNLNHMVALTYQASTGNVAMYLDGVSLVTGTLPAKGSAGSPFGSTATTNVLADIVGSFNGVNGNSPTTTDASLNGSTDEFRILNNVQSTAQVLTDFTAGPTVGVPEPATLGLSMLGALGLLARRRRTH